MPSRTGSPDKISFLVLHIGLQGESTCFEPWCAISHQPSYHSPKSLLCFHCTKRDAVRTRKRSGRSVRSILSGTEIPDRRPDGSASEAVGSAEGHEGEDSEAGGERAAAGLFERAGRERGCARAAPAVPPGVHRDKLSQARVPHHRCPHRLLLRSRLALRVCAQKGLHPPLTRIVPSAALFLWLSPMLSPCGHVLQASLFLLSLLRAMCSRLLYLSIYSCKHTLQDFFARTSNLAHTLAPEPSLSSPSIPHSSLLMHLFS